ncbi:MAG: 50S ribosomal protein L29 [Longimonas sp.]|uniref:50S ribosomal protein L29 n=1 Tax=Longimonas sp. TaxID=2039626 RepID=UPI003348F395
MKAKDIRDLSIAEIEARIVEEEDQLERLRFRHSVHGRLENPMILRTKRRFVARLKTILTEKKAEATA